MGLTADQKEKLNTMCPVAAELALGDIIDDALQVSSGDIADGAVTSGKIADGAITSAKILDGAVATADLANNAVTLLKLATGVIGGVAYEDSLTTDRDTHNAVGLAAAIALANDLKTKYNAHCADATEHTTLADAVNVVGADAATNLATLITLITEMLTKYDAHEGDAELGALWVYHAAQEAGDHSLASVAAPTHLNECITRINDFKLKYNAHDADGNAHGDQALHATAVADAALSATIKVTVPGVQVGDMVVWGIINDGTGNVTGISATPGAGFINFTFSAEPQDDAVITYAVFRTAA